MSKKCRTCHEGELVVSREIISTSLAVCRTLSCRASRWVTAQRAGRLTFRFRG